ncbi:MAG: hypothetical protein IGS39_04220 [Calothrix sp. C42_A2020_038]|nr:hypothetical protein [Calothrix sp. C42_A2020_038]
MPRTKPFKNLLEQMAPERRVKIETQVQLALLHLAFVERQKSSGYTDEDIDISELQNMDDIEEFKFLKVLSFYDTSLPRD